MKHTALALPWAVGGNHVDRDNLQIASLGDYIGEVYGHNEKAKARLEYIVRACNSHYKKKAVIDELVKACKLALKYMPFQDARDIIEDALANATR